MRRLKAQQQTFLRVLVLRVVFFPYIHIITHISHVQRDSASGIPVPLLSELWHHFYLDGDIKAIAVKYEIAQWLHKIRSQYIAKKMTDHHMYT